MRTLITTTLRTVLLALAIGFATGTAFAQQGTNEEGKMTQTITWSRAANAFFYEVEIERQTDGSMMQVATHRTEDVTLAVSLPPGMYRYRILTYNMLSRVANTSEWTGFRIYAAILPVIERFTPSSYAVDSLQKQFTITFSGSDLSLEAVAVLKKQTRDDRPSEEIAPLSVEGTVAAETLNVTFSSEGLTTGTYDIIITNPGGLSSTVEFKVGFLKKVDITISAGYAPIIPFTGATLKDSYGETFNPLSFYARFTAIPFKRLWGSIGAELTPMYTRLEKPVVDGSLTGNLITANLNAVYQKWFLDYTLALNIKAGGGIAFLSQQAPYADTANSLFYSISAGAGVQWYFRKNLFADIGINYNHLIDSIDSGQNNFAAGFIGVGWRL